jgi:hypothetical protein
MQRPCSSAAARDRVLEFAAPEEEWVVCPGYARFRFLRPLRSGESLAFSPPFDRATLADLARKLGADIEVVNENGLCETGLDTHFS